MFGTYHADDVEILLKDITGLVTPTPTAEREKRIQSGVPYCEMLPLEYEPSEKYLQIYAHTLSQNAEMTARAVGRAAAQIMRRHDGKPVLVSLARAGTPIGILLKRYIDFRYHVNVPHYTISIIKGKGIDKNALSYILQRHEARSLQFVDGWTGKGAIQDVLREALRGQSEIRPGVAVLSDPAGVAEISGTDEDFLIPSACLNATVSGLLSRTFLRDDVIGEHDFHGAVFYRELLERDRTYEFIDTVQSHFRMEDSEQANTLPPNGEGYKEALAIGKDFQISDMGLVKPGIAETIRVLLRRVPWKIFVRSLSDSDNLGAVYQLAEEKHVEVAQYPLRHYRACGLIRACAEV